MPSANHTLDVLLSAITLKAEEKQVKRPAGCIPAGWDTYGSFASHKLANQKSQKLGVCDRKLVLGSL